MAITNSTIDLEWTAATDNVGVVSYQIFQSTDNVVFNEIHESDGVTLAYTATGLTPSTKYYFKQTAKDAAGNQSTYGNTVQDTTLSGGVTPIDWDYSNMIAGFADSDTLLQLSFINETVDVTSVPLGSDFTVKVNGAIQGDGGITVGNNYVRINLPAPFSSGDTVTVSYTAGTNPLKAQGTGNLVPNIVDVACDNILVPSFSYLLDDYPGASAAFSLRKLRTGIVQGIMVRRDSDDQLVDVRLYDDPSKSIDLDSITESGGQTLGDWVSGASAYIFNWYDQSGSGRNLSQLSDANQYRIINAGTLIAENNQTAFENVANSFMKTAGATEIPQPIFTSTVITGNTGGICVVYDSNSGVVNTMRWLNPNYQLRAGVNWDTAGAFTLDAQTGITATTNGANSIFRVNTVESLGNGGANPLQGITLGRHRTSTNYFGGKYQELIFWSGANIPDAVGIETEMNSVYNIWVVTADVDAQLIQADNDGLSNTVLEINGVRSSASDTAVANLISRNVTVITS